MNAALEAAIDKIRKLQALGQSDNPHEAALAMAHAQRLMLKYQISEAMIAQEGGVDGVEHEEITNTHAPLWRERRNATWFDRLAVALCEAHGCKAYGDREYAINGNGRSVRTHSLLRVIGRASDVNVVRYLLQYCRAEVERLERAAIERESTFRDPRDGTVLFRRAAPGKTWRNNFKHGVVDSILRAVRREREELLDELRASAGTNTRALVVVDSAAARVVARFREAEVWGKVHLRLRKCSSGGARGDARARALGREAGDGVYEGARGNRTRLGGAAKRLGRG